MAGLLIPDTLRMYEYITGFKTRYMKGSCQVLSCEANLMTTPGAGDDDICRRAILLFTSSKYFDNCFQLQILKEYVPFSPEMESSDGKQWFVCSTSGMRPFLKRKQAKEEAGFLERSG